MQQVSPGPRRRLWVYAPLALVLLLAAGWSAFWFYAAHRAEGTIAAWIDREAQAGRVHACGQRTIGGYPFRIELRCEDVRSQLHGFGRPVELRTASLVAVAQVYEPTLVIADLTGPMTISLGEPAAEYTVDWRRMQASLRGFPFAFERASIALDDAAAMAAGANAGKSPLARAKHFEFHVRRRPGTAGPDPLFDLAGRLEAAVFGPALTPALSERPIDADVEAVAHGVKDLTPKPVVQRLRDWQANGGRLEVKSLRVAQGDAVAVASGDLGLTSEGLANGALRVRLAGLDYLGGLIFGPDAQATTVLRGIAMLAGRSELEGKRAVTLPLRFKDGAAFLGPLPIGRTPPLY